MSSRPAGEHLPPESAQDEREQAQRAARRENQLALALTTFLRVARLHALDNAAVQAALADFARALGAFLSDRDKAALLVVAERIYLNGRLVRAGPAAGGWLEDLRGLLARHGIGGLLFSGSWNERALRAVAGAFAGEGRAGAAARCQAVAAAARRIAPPARLDVLDPAEAEAFAQEAEEGDLSPSEQAVFYYARLVALLEACHRVMREGRAPEVYGRHVRQTLMTLVELMDVPAIERRLLALTLVTPSLSDPLATHAAQVTVLVLAMGRLLGLPRGELADLGFAACFHDAGRLDHPRRGDPAGGEDLGCCESSLRAGVRRALQGRSASRAALLRLVVAREHHAESHGLPRLAERPHPASQLVGIADAYVLLEQGTAWRAPLDPPAALEALAAAARFPPVLVELLRDVLGAYPRGSFLRLPDGATGVVIDGGAARGHRPVVRRFLDAGGLALGEGRVEELDDPSACARVAGRTLGVAPWRVVFGRAALAEGSRSGIQRWRTPPATARGRTLEPARAVPSEDRQAVRRILEALQLAVRCFRLYPARHPRRQQALDELLVLLGPYLEWHRALELAVRREGLYLEERLVLPDGGRASDLGYLLYPEGIRWLRLELGVDRRELRALVETLGREDEEGELPRARDDLLSALWQRELPHIQHVASDPLSPAAIERQPDPTLEAIGRRIRGLMNVWAPDSPERAAELARFIDGLPAPCGHPAGWEGAPARRDEFLASPAGKARAGFRARLCGEDEGALQTRALRVLAWGLQAEPRPRPEDLSYWLRGAALAALGQGELEAAARALEVATAAGAQVLAAVSPRVSGRRALELIADRLAPETRSAEALHQAERFLNALGDGALSELARAYGSLKATSPLRPLLRACLRERAGRVPRPLADLALHPDEAVAREAIELLACAPARSPGRALLAACAGDRAHPRRADLARAALDEVSGARERRARVAVVLEGNEQNARLEAARELARDADPRVFDALSQLVASKEFRARDPEEIDAILEALTRSGGLRSVRLLEDLQGRAGLLAARGTRRVAEAAGTWLEALRSERKDRKITAGYQRLGPVCARCRFQNIPDAESCLSCGALFPREPDPAPSPAPPAGEDPAAADPITRPHLLVRRAGRLGQPINDEVPPPRTQPAPAPARGTRGWLRCPPFPPLPLGASPRVRVGRHSSCDLVLPHASVSRFQFDLRLEEGQVLLENQSTYGTCVNAQPVGRQALAPGDVITCGPYTLVFEGPHAE